MGVIYLIKHKESGKCYVGQTTRRLTGRILKHQRVDGSPYLHNALKKYGRDAFDVSVLGEAEKGVALDELETALIAEHNAMHPNGYNLRQTGQGVWHHPETVEKIRLKAIEQHASPESRDASAVRKGSEPFKLYNVNTGEVVWAGLNKTKCSKEMGLLRSDIRNILNSPVRCAKGIVGKYDLDCRPVMLREQLDTYRQIAAQAAGTMSIRVPNWLILFPVIK